MSFPPLSTDKRLAQRTPLRGSDASLFLQSHVSRLRQAAQHQSDDDLRTMRRPPRLAQLSLPAISLILEQMQQQIGRRHRIYAATLWGAQRADPQAVRED